MNNELTEAFTWLVYVGAAYLGFMAIVGVLALCVFIFVFVRMVRE